MSSTSADKLSAFDQARVMLVEARRAQRALVGAWDALRAERPFSCRVEPGHGAKRSVIVACTPAAEHQRRIQGTAADFAVGVKRTMDQAVWAAAHAVCGQLLKVDRDLHKLPLVRTQSEFEMLVGVHEQLLGLRPDQVHVLRTIQPFSTGSAQRAEVARLMSTLLNLLELDPLSPRVSLWLSDAHIQIRVNGRISSLATHEVLSLRVPIGGSALLSSIEVGAEDVDRVVEANPNAALDLILDVEPWPRDPDDNATIRTNGLLRVAETLIDGLEASVMMPPLIAQVRQSRGRRPSDSETAWRPVRFDSRAEEARVRDGLAQSDLGLASYRDLGGQLVLLQLVQGAVVGREVPQARVPIPAGPRGPGVEHASLEAASSWGLPDFVYRPRVLSKGSGIREVGDGTIITGGKGLALQIKAREAPTSNPARETSWVTKKAAQAIRQAHGTIRTSLDVTELRLENLRGREAVLDGTRIEWLPVVLLDHDQPPEGVRVTVPATQGVVLLRRDWEFLWDQLRSASAVVDYLHRVSGSPSPALGDEATRYMELALADDVAETTPPPNWMRKFSAHQPGGPVLPRDLASAQDAGAHAVFNEILNDIALTDFTGDETTRLKVLSLLDRVPVFQRAELGRLLLEQLDAAMIAAPDTLLTYHRTMMIDEGRLHIAFSVFSSLTGYFRNVYEQWLLLRRQQLLEAREGRSDEVWTVGVLLTPCPDGRRMWDTTVSAVQGEPELDAEQRARLEELWPLDER